MFKYTIDAYDADQFGKVTSIIQLVVRAASEGDALERAAKIAARGNYKVVCIEDISLNIAKVMAGGTLEPGFDDDGNLKEISFIPDANPTNLPPANQTRSLKKG